MDGFSYNSVNVQLVELFNESQIDGESLEKIYIREADSNDHKYQKMMLVPENPLEDMDIGIVAEPIDYQNEEDSLLVDNVNRALFYIRKVYFGRQDICEKMYLEKLPDHKREIILNEYFSGLQDFKSTNIVYEVLQQAASLGMVLWNDFECVDLYNWFELADSLAERYSVEDVYLYFSLWRLTAEKKYMNKTIKAADEFFVQYLYVFSQMPGASKLIERVHDGKIFERLAIVISKFLIAIKGTKILYSRAMDYGTWSEDRFVKAIDDETIITRNSSFYSLLLLRALNPDKDDEYIKDFISLSNVYRALVKANDILIIFTEILRMFYEFDDAELTRYMVSKDDVETLYRLSLLIKDNYQEEVFRNQTFFGTKRKRYNLERISIEETKNAELAKQAAMYQSVIDEIEKKNAGTIREIIDDQLELTSGFLKNDIDSLMRAKQNYLSKIEYYATDIQIQKLEVFIGQLKKRLEEAIANEYDYSNFYELISDDFKKYADRLFKYPSLLNCLASAEFLYNRFISQKGEQKDFDYSCVSIMYYMSLEEFINKLLYMPYKRKVLDPHKAELFSSKKFLYKPNNYIRNQDLKESCELGPLAYLLKNIKRTEALVKFIDDEFGVGKERLDAIEKFGQDLLNHKDNRNNAAHGGTNITYDTAKGDKTIVYPHEQLDNIRGLLKDFLKLFLD